MGIKTNPNQCSILSDCEPVIHKPLDPKVIGSGGQLELAKRSSTVWDSLRSMFPSPKSFVRLTIAQIGSLVTLVLFWLAVKISFESH